MSRSVVRALQGLVLWSERFGRARLTVRMYEAVVASVSLYLRVGSPRTRTAYVRGSLAGGAPVYGYSDVDLAIVCADDPASPGADRIRVRRRWQRASRLFPPLRHVVELAVYERAELAAASSARS